MKFLKAIALAAFLSASANAGEVIKFSGVTVATGTLHADIESASGLKLHGDRTTPPDGDIMYEEVSGELAITIYAAISQSVRNLIIAAVGAHQ